MQYISLLMVSEVAIAKKLEQYTYWSHYRTHAGDNLIITVHRGRFTHLTRIECHVNDRFLTKRSGLFKHLAFYI